MNKILNWIGLAKKAGKLEVGEEPTGAAARAHAARLIITASDAAENTQRRARHFAEAGNTTVLPIPFTKEELGGLVGRSSCAMFAITDIGFAAGLAGKLAEVDLENYASAAQTLALASQKAEQRKKEARLHEKNLKLGKNKGRGPGSRITSGKSKV